jgi:transposase-like protein
MKRDNLPLTNSERSLYVGPMITDTKDAISVICKTCDLKCQSIGKHRNGLRRFRCPNCRRSYTEPHRRTLDSMYIRQDRACLALQLLLEGNSLRSTQRITGLDVNTIMALLVKAGERCQSLMDAKLRNLHGAHPTGRNLVLRWKETAQRARWRLARSRRSVGVCRN